MTLAVAALPSAPITQAALPGFADLTLAVLSLLADDLRSPRQRKDARAAIAAGAHLAWIHKLDVSSEVVERLAEHYEELADDAGARPRELRRYLSHRV